jgi:predicted component of type VI protein secretion system
MKREEVKERNTLESLQISKRCVYETMLFAGMVDMLSTLSSQLHQDYTGVYPQETAPDQERTNSL